MYALFFTSTIPFERMRTDGSAKKGRNNGIKCGLENLHPESTIELLIFPKFEDTFSNGSNEIIPPSWRGSRA